MIGVLLVGLGFGLGNAHNQCLHLKMQVLSIGLGFFLGMPFYQLHAGITYGY